MEPRQHGFQGGYEQAGQQPPSSEQMLVPSPEIGETSRQERMETAPRQEAQPAVPQVPALPIPTPIAPASDDSAAQQVDDSALLAADEDLIEKEWVDRAKQILNDTRDDPHAREREIRKLQAEYIKQRYGRIIGQQGE